MRTPFGIRLRVLIAALLLVAGGTIYGLFSAWHRVQDVEAKLTTSQIERFQLASRVRRELQSLNNSMLRYVLARNPQQWALFEQASGDLNHWIDSNDPSMNPKSPLATDAERELFQELNPRLPVVLMTAHGTIETAIEATKLGAYDYLQKPFEMPELISVLHRAVEASRLMREPVTLPNAPVESRTALVGTGRAMQNVCKEIGRVAAKPVTVLIRGETGTGKELIARAIYQHSPRAKAPFIAINCAAIPENLLESELFGHERGAFTGADQRRIGRFEQANKGTLFLDEIGDLPPNTQVKLLRVLQQQTFQRVGGAEAISVDVRVIAATHRNLEAEFRDDLFHRLNVVCLQLPPLRERPEDIPVLVQHFLRKYAGDFGVESPTISSDAVAVLQSDSWPGNVRELENMTRRLLLGARGLSINADAVRQTLAARNAETAPTGNSFAAFAGDLLARAQKGDLQDAHTRMLAEAEREVLTQAITLAEGNQAKAARWLGLSRFTLREKLKQLGLHPDSTVANSETEG